MEQQIYTSAVRGEKVGFQTIAKSVGLSMKDVAFLQPLYGFFGPWPTIPERGVVSFLRIDADRWVVWKRFPVKTDASGKRNNFWVHSFILNHEELRALEGDPFVLEDEHMFQPPSKLLTYDIPSVPAPQFKHKDNLLSPLLDLTSRQVDVFLSAGLCQGSALVAADGIHHGLVRALIHLLPLPQRPQMTFYGLVTGCPLRPAKLVIVPNINLANVSKCEVVAVASIGAERYKGPTPTPYAAAIARYINQQHIRSALDMVEFAESLELKVLERDTASLVNFFEKLQLYIENLKVEDITRAVSSLKEHCNKETLAEVYKDAMLAVAERAVETGADGHELLQALASLNDPSIQLSVLQSQRFDKLLSRGWNLLDKNPKLLLDLLIMSGTRAHVLDVQLNRLLLQFDKYYLQCREFFHDDHERIAFLDRLLKVVSQYSGKERLAERLRVKLISDAIAVSPDDLFPVFWGKYGSDIQYEQNLLTIVETLWKARPLVIHVPIVIQILRRAVPQLKTEHLRKSLAWSRTQPLVFAKFMKVWPELCDSVESGLKLAWELVEDRTVSSDEFCRLFAAAAQKDNGIHAANFARTLPIQCRYIMLKWCHEKLPKQKWLLSILIETLFVDYDIENATTIVKLIWKDCAFYRKLPPKIRQQLTTILAWIRYRYPSTRADQLLCLLGQKKGIIPGLLRFLHKGFKRLKERLSANW